MKFDIRKCGDMYIDFDENKNPKYGYTIDYDCYSLNKLINLSHTPNTVVIPDATKDYAYNSEDDLAHKFTVVDHGCLRGLKNLTIIIPNGTNVVFEHGAFDYDTPINFVVPKGKEVTFVTQFSNGWIDIADFITQAIVIASKTAVRQYFKSSECEYETLEQAQKDTKSNHFFASQYITKTDLNGYIKAQKERKTILKNPLVKSQNKDIEL